jgi:hypothetical protein
MDLKQLEYFVHVAELGSFTRAAAYLQVAQPALSRQVRSLEVELRQPLLDRNGRGVTLTEAGKRCWRMRAASCSRCSVRATTSRTSAVPPPAAWRSRCRPASAARSPAAGAGLPRAAAARHAHRGRRPVGLCAGMAGHRPCRLRGGLQRDAVADHRPAAAARRAAVPGLGQVGAGPPHRRAGDAARGGRARAGDSQPAAFDAHAAGGCAGRRGLPCPCGAGDRKRARPSWTSCSRATAMRCWPKTRSAPAASPKRSSCTPSCRRWWPRCGWPPRPSVHAGPLIEHATAIAACRRCCAGRPADQCRGPTGWRGLGLAVGRRLRGHAVGLAGPGAQVDAAAALAAERAPGVVAVVAGWAAGRSGRSR